MKIYVIDEESTTTEERLGLESALERGAAGVATPVDFAKTEAVVVSVDFARTPNAFQAKLLDAYVKAIHGTAGKQLPVLVLPNGEQIEALDADDMLVAGWRKIPECEFCKLSVEDGTIFKDGRAWCATCRPNGFAFGHNKKDD